MSISTNSIYFPETTTCSSLGYSNVDGMKLVLTSGRDDLLFCGYSIGINATVLDIYSSNIGGSVRLSSTTKVTDAAGTLLIDNGVWQVSGGSTDKNEIVIGPNPDSNANIVSIELSGSHFNEFTVSSISLQARDAGSVPTTSPVYLSIWKQVSGDNYSLLAVSKEAKTQVISEWTKWEFDNVELTGARIRIAAIATPTTPFAQASQLGIRVQARGDDDSCILHGTQNPINYHPAMIMRSEDSTKYAPLSHVSDEDKHLRTGERASWNSAVTNANAALNNTTTLATNLAQEKNEALQHLYWHHSGNYASLAALMGPNGSQYFPEALHVTQAEKDKWNNATSGGGFNDTGYITGGTANETFSLAVGGRSNSFAYAVAVGIGTSAMGEFSTVIGTGARADYKGSFALGFSAEADNAGEGVMKVSTDDSRSSDDTVTKLKLVGAGSTVSTAQLGGACGLGYKEKTADYRYAKLKDIFDLADRAADILALLK